MAVFVFYFVGYLVIPFLLLALVEQGFNFWKSLEGCARETKVVEKRAGGKSEGGLLRLLLLALMLPALCVFTLLEKIGF